MFAAALTAALLAATPAAKPLVVAIDPGHGGTVQGATGPNGLEEGALCLQLALRLKPLLERTLGAQVVLTRSSDVDVALADRIQLANRARADVFISIHANSMPTRRLRSKIEGIETYFLSLAASGDLARRTADRENAEVGGKEVLRASGDPLAFILQDLARTEAHADSSRLAYAVHQKMVAATGAQDRGVQQAPFFVLNGVDAPAILLEVGFISHPEESARLKDPRYQDRLAAAIADGVKTYLTQVKPADDSTARNAAR